MSTSVILETNRPGCKLMIFLCLYIQLTQLEARNKELAQEMERVRMEMEKTKTECAKTIKEEKKFSRKEMERLRQELEKVSQKLAHQKMSKSEAHEELLRVQQDNEVC